MATSEAAKEIAQEWAQREGIIRAWEYLAEKIDAAIQAAVLAEREACAAVADGLGITPTSEKAKKETSDPDEQIAFTHADSIASAIRNRTKENDR